MARADVPVNGWHLPSSDLQTHLRDCVNSALSTTLRTSWPFLLPRIDEPNSRPGNFETMLAFVVLTCAQPPKIPPES